jgi:hypothetical protein
MAAHDPPSTKVLDALHDWQRRAGLPLTWPATVSRAFVEQWRIILELSAPAGSG